MEPTDFSETQEGASTDPYRGAETECGGARQRLSKDDTAEWNKYATILELFDASLSMRSVSYLLVYSFVRFIHFVQKEMHGKKVKSEGLWRQLSTSQSYI